MEDETAALSNRLKSQMAAMFNMPIKFWRQVLGNSMGFHLGHFSSVDTSLAESMSASVHNLAKRIECHSSCKVLDIGCGWGQPAFELASYWKASVLGITTSVVQSEYIERTAVGTGLDVSTLVTDAESPALLDLGSYDVIWLCEVLEHVIKRDVLLERLHAAVKPGGWCLLTVSCDCVGREAIYSEILGVQSLDTPVTILRRLHRAGWTVVDAMDCTNLTLPVWKYWNRNLAEIRNPEWEGFASQLLSEFEELSKLYEAGLLSSVQIVARS